jgi:hypothetical protein
MLLTFFLILVFVYAIFGVPAVVDISYMVGVPSVLALMLLLEF